MLYLISFHCLHIFYQWSNLTSELMCHWLFKEYCESDVDSEKIRDSTLNEGPSPHAIALRHLTSLPFIQLVPIQHQQID
jgi:hypothetical protein